VVVLLLLKSLRNVHLWFDEEKDRKMLWFLWVFVLLILYSVNN